MCSFCAMMTGGGVHWSEAGSDAAQSDAPAGRDRLLERRRRVTLVNRVLAHHGCKLADWNNNSYILKSQRGRTEIVDSLPQVWALAEKISKKPADPLDPDLLAALSNSNPGRDR
jgi:hypothetical protein